MKFDRIWVPGYGHAPKVFEEDQVRHGDLPYSLPQTLQVGTVQRPTTLSSSDSAGRHGDLPHSIPQTMQVGTEAYHTLVLRF